MGGVARRWPDRQARQPPAVAVVGGGRRGTTVRGPWRRSSQRSSRCPRTSRERGTELVFTVTRPLAAADLTRGDVVQWPVQGPDLPAKHPAHPLRSAVTAGAEVPA